MSEHRTHSARSLGKWLKEEVETLLVEARANLAKFDQVREQNAEWRTEQGDKVRERMAGFVADLEKTLPSFDQMKFDPVHGRGFWDLKVDRAFEQVFDTLEKAIKDSTQALSGDFGAVMEAAEAGKGA